MAGIRIGDEYYNEDYKRLYLKERYDTNNHVMKTVDLLFRRIYPWELRLGKDLYDFSVTEILEFYKSLFSSSLESIMVMNNQYKIYTDYALTNGVVEDNQNHYAEINLKILNSCVNIGWAAKKVISREELLEVLRSEDVENVSDKVIALAIFEGIGGKQLVELSQLEPTDINLQTNMVKLCTGRELKISDQLKDWCIESAEEYNYYNSLAKKDNKSYLSSDTRVVKRLSNSTTDTDSRRHKTITRRLERLQDVTNVRAFGVGSLKESGRLEMIKDLREKGIPLHDALRNKDMIDRYGRVSSPARYILKYNLQ